MMAPPPAGARSASVPRGRDVTRAPELAGPLVGLSGQSNLQPELFGVPAPTRERPGRCWLPTRNGATRPCCSPASGTVRDWLAPLDPAQAIPACLECARTFGYVLDPF